MGACSVAGVKTLAEALATMLECISPVAGVETLPLRPALGRILAEDLCSPLAVPSFDNAAMDGYALRLADATPEAVLGVAGKAFAGQPFTGDWPAGSCIRIMTGAPVPPGTDAVVMQEHTLATATGIRLLQPPVGGQNIRRAGEEIRAGELVLRAGTRLGARELPLLAALGIARVPVYRQLKVALFSTGDELKPVGAPLGAGDIYDSNRYGVHAMLERMGVQCLDLGMVPDEPTALRAAFLLAAQADAVITSGGVSVGEADYTRELLAQLGEVGFWKVAIKPGKPFAFGRFTGRPRPAWFFGLPGNPVSAMITFYQLVQPALRRLAGETPRPPLRLKARAEQGFRVPADRIDFQRGILSCDPDGSLRVTGTGFQGSGAVGSLSRANCFVVLDPAWGQVGPGDWVLVEPFNEVLQ